MEIRLDNPLPQIVFFPTQLYGCFVCKVIAFSQSRKGRYGRLGYTALNHSIENSAVTGHRIPHSSSWSQDGLTNSFSEKISRLKCAFRSSKGDSTEINTLDQYILVMQMLESDVSEWFLRRRHHVSSVRAGR